jgi:hypothetical protein
MTERECNYKIVAFVNGERKEIKCDPSKGCLNNLVWSGIGVTGAAAQMLQIEQTEKIEAFVTGSCKKLSSSESNLK